ncbi:hypothetical protein ACGFN1_13045 [Streptomyces sp. NPDC048685]
MAEQHQGEHREMGRQTTRKYLLQATLGGLCSAVSKWAFEWWLGWWGNE